MLNKRFPESTSRTQTHKVIIPNLKEISDVTVDTGSVEIVSINGEEVTLRFTGGRSTRRSLGGGVLIPADSRIMRVDRTQTEKYYYIYAVRAGGEWQHWETVNAIDNTLEYDSDGYSGTLSLLWQFETNRTTYDFPPNPNFGDVILRYNIDVDVRYEGTVSRPESDTRWWRYYYRYGVTINYKEKGFDIRVKKDGQIRTSTEGWVKVGGVLRPIDRMYTKVNGQLKTID